MNYEMLSMFCQNNNLKLVRNLLTHNHEIVNILYDEGRFFKIAIQYNFPEVLKILLSYYEDKILDGDPTSNDYLHKKHSLREAIENALDLVDNEVSSEIQEVIDPYLLKDNSVIEEENLLHSLPFTKEEVQSDAGTRPSIIIGPSTAEANVGSDVTSTVNLLTVEYLRTKEESELSAGIADREDLLKIYLDEQLIASREGTPEQAEDSGVVGDTAEIQEQTYN